MPGSHDLQEAGPFDCHLAVRLIRIFLLLLMSLLVLMMVSWPAFYDSWVSGEAYQEYVRAPSEFTKLGIEKARQEDKKAIAVFRSIFLVLFATCVYAFVRAGKEAIRTGPPPRAASNDGPATPPADPRVTEGPPSVNR